MGHFVAVFFRKNWLGLVLHLKDQGTTSLQTHSMAVLNPECCQPLNFGRKDSVNRGSASVHVGIPPPWEQTPLEKTLPWEQTPLEQTPPGSRQPPLREQTPLLLGSRLRHTVNEQPVRIPLECILVYVTV